MLLSFKKISTLDRNSLQFRLLRIKNRQLYNPVESVNIDRSGVSAYSKPEIDNEVIFVHIPKAAGNSISEAVFHTQGTGHAILNKYYIDNPDYFERFYKFSFIRNPWDRFVSAFTYLSQGGRHARDAEIARWLIGDRSFTEFLEASVRNPWLQRRVMNQVHFVPQYIFLDGPQGRTVDDLFRVEAMEEGMEALSRKLDRKLQVSKTNTSQRDDYRNYYKKDHHVDIVQRLYLQDIKQFGYGFE